MATTLKCPNPSCPYQFDPSAVPVGVVLACPRCTMRFTLGSPATSQQGNAQPGGPGSSGMNRVFSGMTTTPSRETAPRVSRLPRRGSRLQTVLLFGVAVVATMSAAVAVWYKLTHKTNELPPDLARKFKDKNFSLEPPSGSWVRDEEMRATLDSPYMLVYRRDDPDKKDQPTAYMAIGVRDFETREPRTSELRNGLLDPLKKLLEPNTLDAFDATPSSTWLGMDVKGFRYRGRLKTSPVIEGEAYYVSHKGIAYWFLGWCGENASYEEQKNAFADLRARCKLLDLRKDWKPASNVASYKNNVVGYAIFDVDELWRENADEKDIRAEDPNADKMLVLKLGNKKDIQKVGTLVTYILPTAGDPIAEARQFITDKRIAEIKVAGEDYKVEFKDRTGPVEGDPTGNTIDASAPVIRFESIVQDALNQNRLHVVSAAKIGEKLVVVHAWCDFADRAAFEANFVQIVGSLRAGTDTN